MSTKQLVFGSAKEKKGVLSTLKKIEKTFKDGKAWIKDAWEETIYAEDDEHCEIPLGTGYCLIGAAQHVDGPFEEQTIQTMARILDPKTPVEDQERCYDYPGDDTVVTFNDAKTTKWKHIKAFLKKCQSRVEKAKIVKV